MNLKFMHIPLCLLSVFTMILCLLGLGLDSPWATAEEVLQWDLNSVNQHLPSLVPLLLSTSPSWRSLLKTNHSLQGRQRWQIWVTLRPHGRLWSEGHYEIILNGMTTDPLPLFLVGRGFLNYALTFSRYGWLNFSADYGMNLHGETYRQDQARTLDANESVTLRFSFMPDGRIMGDGQYQLSLAGALNMAQQQQLFQGHQLAGARVRFNPRGYSMGQGYSEIAATGQVNTDTEQRTLQIQSSLELAAGFHPAQQVWLTTRQRAQLQGELFWVQRN